MRFVVLALLAACWTAPATQTVEPRKPRLTFRTKPTCWSSEFHAQWPAEIDAREETDKCRDQWIDEPEKIDACVATTYWFAYQQLKWWTTSWFESCDPKR